MTFCRSLTRPSSSCALLGSMRWLSLSLLLLAPSIRVASGNNVLCPGQPDENYCDCAGDCTGFPEWCGCREANDCCAGAKSVVLCPGQPSENYCDCTGDCKEQPGWCSCQEARECCNGASSHDRHDDDDHANGNFWSASNVTSINPFAGAFVVAGCVGGAVLLLLAMALFRCVHPFYDGDGDDRHNRGQRRSVGNSPKANPGGGGGADDSDASTVLSDDDDDGGGEGVVGA